MPLTNEFHPFKAVAIDLDGTLLSHDLTISAENHAAIERLHASGVCIILASGRHSSTMLPYARKLPVEWMVSAQGAFAANLDESTILYDNLLPPQKAKEIIDAGIANMYSIVIYARSGIYTLSQGEWIDYYTALASIAPTPTTQKDILEESILKVALIDSEERIDKAFALPEISNWDLYKVRSLKNIYEFAGRGTSKADGLKPLLAHLNIAASELASFGDAPNDNPMFEISGYSVAMTHAWDETKAAAHAISPEGPAESSFARAVELLQKHAR